MLHLSCLERMEVCQMSVKIIIYTGLYYPGHTRKIQYQLKGKKFGGI